MNSEELLQNDVHNRRKKYDQLVKLKEIYIPTVKPASSFKAFLTIFANNAKRKRTTDFIHSFVACFVTCRFIAKAKAHCAIKHRTLTSEDEFPK